MTDNGIKAAGGCLCGAVRYQIIGKLRGVVNCHCSKCRRFHGNYGAYTSVALEHLEFVEKRGLKWFKSTADETAGVHRGFCAECGASLFWHPRDRERISVAAGSIDGPTRLKTISHIWISQIGDYYSILDDLPRYDKGCPK